MSRLAIGISISHFMADHYKDGSIVLPDPYASEHFTVIATTERDRDIVFVGRLIADKGAQILLDAIAHLKSRGRHVTATIVGDGPERPNLEAKCNRLSLDDTVVFTGRLRGMAVADIIRRHRVMAIPSVWPEPFGVVALEGLASGCKLVASDIGGLPDATGPCGILVRPGDAAALASGLRAALDTVALSHFEAQQRLEHLGKHSPEFIAEQYIRVFSGQPIL